MPGIDSFAKLMLHMNGADESTSFPDSSDSSHSVTPVGNTQIDTAQSVFGSASALFDGSDYLTIPDSADWDFETDDYTIDFRFRTNNLTADNTICSRYSGEDKDSWLFQIQSTGKLRMYAFNSAGVRSDSAGGGGWISTATLAVDTWYHIAIVQTSDKLEVYIDGVKDINLSPFAQNIDNNIPFEIGSLATGPSYNGWIDEFRVSKGIARWTSNFTPPTEEYSPLPPPEADVLTAIVFQNPVIPRLKKPKTNPGWSVTPGMHVPVPIKLDKWAHIYNTPVRTKKRNRANTTQNILVEFNIPTLPEVIMDSWFQQQQLARIKKRGNPNSHVDIDFIEAIQEQNGNYFDTGVFGFKITKESDEAATFADTGVFGITITGEHVEDFQLEDVEAFSFTIKYPDIGNEVFNSGVPGFVSANVIINGTNESAMIQGAISVTREDNTAARFKCILEFDQALVPPRKPAGLINNIVSISFAAADMDGIVADYIPIFVGLCKHVSFNDDQGSVIMSGYDYGGTHQTRGEFVSDNVTDVLSGSIYISSAGTHSLGHSPVWGIIFTGNSEVTDGEDYFINTLTGAIIVPVSSRILQFPGAFTYNYQNPFTSMKEIIQSVVTLKGWTLQEDNVSIADYSSVSEHPVLSLSDESIIDVCRKFLELSGAKVESNLFPNLRVYSEVQNVINTVNTHTVDESKIFEDTLAFEIDFDDILNEQTTRSVQKINANVVIGAETSIGEFSGDRTTLNPFTVQDTVTSVWDLNLGQEAILAEHRINKRNLNSISFSSSGRFHAFFQNDSFEEAITGASWDFFIDGDDFVIQLKHKLVVLGLMNSRMYAYPAVEYELTVLGSKINYGDGTIEDVKIVTAQRPIGGISETLKGDVYENPYIETDQHCANICDAILLEHGNPYAAQFQIPVFEGKHFNIGDRLNIERDSVIRFSGIIKILTYSIDLAIGENSILVVAKGVGFGI